MFSAIYLVCMTGQPCMFFVDPKPYPTVEVCKVEAENNIIKNSNNPNIPPFEAEFQCISWEKA